MARSVAQATQTIYLNATFLQVSDLKFNRNYNLFRFHFFEILIEKLK